MNWKYWEPWEAWDGSRSYVLEREGAIIAHGGVWPVELPVGGDLVPGFGLIDWAADPASAGAGMSLTSRMFRLADVVCVIGGSEDALRLRAAMGFRPRNRIEVMARPLRPLRQILGEKAWNWKTPARLTRNMAWSMTPAGSCDQRWTAPEIKPAAAQEVIDRGSLRLIERLLECPAVQSSLRVVSNDGRPVGWYLLAFALGQARIAGCGLASATAAEWMQLYRLALEEARRNRDTNEVVTFASTAAQREALEACGFHVRRAYDVQVYDPRGRIPADAQIEFQMIHGDAAFLNEGRPAYLT